MASPCNLDAECMPILPRVAELVKRASGLVLPERLVQMMALLYEPLIVQLLQHLLQLQSLPIQLLGDNQPPIILQILLGRTYAG